LDLGLLEEQARSGRTAKARRRLSNATITSHQGECFMAGLLSTVSWFDNSGVHLRVYTVNGTNITEQGWDGSGPWYTGLYNATGSTVGATAWLDKGGTTHIRVYSALNGEISERCWDGSRWYEGAMKASGVGATASSWVDGSGNAHIRVYVRASNNAVTEQCWDGSGWYVGAYRGTAHG
jgi:hypothetical protein